MIKSLENLNFTFEKDINFLRAIAVISVILFHSSFFSNGYLGVDIFFVISGYVITKVLTKDFVNKKFSLSKFYVRRIKRLYPALILMIFISYFLYLFFGIINPSDFNEISKTAITGLLGLSNLYFLLRDQNYFIEDDNNFFLHLWSLGVEEQYYFLYPIFLFLVLRYLKNINQILLLFSFTILTLFFIRTIDYKLLNNFFSPFFRFNELFLGCLAFFIKSKIKIKFEFFNSLLILLLIILVFTNLLNFNLLVEVTIVSILTFLILISENNKINFFSKFIKNKFFFIIGDISYSMYLWHLPIVYFLSMYVVDNVLKLILVLLGSISLGFISRHYLEIPIIKKRHNIKFNKKIFLCCAGLFLIIIFANIKPIYKKINKNVENLFLFSKKINIFYNFKFDEKFNSRLLPSYNIKNNILLDNYCFFESNNSNLIKNDLRDQCSKINTKDKSRIFIVYGDCHALHFAPMVNSSKITKNISFIGDVSISKLNQNCFVDDNCETNDSKERKKYYKKNIETINKLSKEYEEVFIISKFLMSDKVKKNKIYENNLKKFIKDIDGSIKIFFIKQTPTFKNKINSCLAVDKYCYGSKETMLKEYKDIDQIIDNIAASNRNIYILDLNNYICPNNKCVYFDKKKDLLYFRDRDNLSDEFSILLSSSFEKEILKLINN